MSQQLLPRNNATAPSNIINETMKFLCSPRSKDNNAAIQAEFDRLLVIYGKEMILQSSESILYHTALGLLANRLKELIDGGSVAHEETNASTSASSADSSTCFGDAHKRSFFSKSNCKAARGEGEDSLGDLPSFGTGAAGRSGDELGDILFETALEEHQRGYTLPGYVCDQSMSGSTVSQLASQVRKVDINSNHKCPYCAQTFNSRKALKQHLLKNWTLQPTGKGYNCCMSRLRFFTANPDRDDWTGLHPYTWSCLVGEDNGTKNDDRGIRNLVYINKEKEIDHKTTKWDSYIDLEQNCDARAFRAEFQNKLSDDHGIDISE